jgi:hypothetical protein
MSALTLNEALCRLPIGCRMQRDDSADGKRELGDQGRVTTAISRLQRVTTRRTACRCVHVRERRCPSRKLDQRPWHGRGRGSRVSLAMSLFVRRRNTASSSSMVRGSYPPTTGSAQMARLALTAPSSQRWRRRKSWSPPLRPAFSTQDAAKPREASTITEAAYAQVSCIFVRRGATMLGAISQSAVCRSKITVFDVVRLVGDPLEAGRIGRPQKGRIEPLLDRLAPLGVADVDDPDGSRAPCCVGGPKGSVILGWRRGGLRRGTLGRLC